MVINKMAVALTLALLLGLGQSSTDIFLPSLAAIGEAYGATPDKVNLLLSSFAVGLAVGCLSCGFLSDRFGRRRSLLVATLVYALSSACIAFSPWLWLAVLLRFIQAYCVAVPVIVSRQIYQETCTPQEQVKYTAYMLLGLTLSPALAPMVGTLIAQYSSWHMDFVFSAVAALPLLAAQWKLIPETSPEKTPLPKPSALLKEFSACFKSRIFTCYALLIMFFYGAFFGFISMSAYIYMAKLKFSSHAFSLTYMTLAIAFLLGNSLLQYLRRSEPPLEKLIMIGLAIWSFGALFSFLSFIEYPNLFVMGVLVAIGAGLMRAGYAVLLPPSQVVILNTGAGRPGVAVGVIYFMQFLAGAIVSSIAASFHARPLHGTVVIMALLTLLGVGAFLLAPRKRMRPEETGVEAAR